MNADINNVLMASNGLCPTLSTTFPIKIEVIVDATEKMAKMMPVQVDEIPLSSRKSGKNGAARQKFMLHRSRIKMSTVFWVSHFISNS